MNAEDELDYPSCKKSPTSSVAPTGHPYHPLAPVTSTAASPSASPSAVVFTSCPNGTYSCSTNNECILRTHRCDGAPHCRDGSDEVGCSCVLRLHATRRALLCDGVPDCWDSSDEECPLCPEGSHECRESRQCVPDVRVCDQKFDCTFGEDEIGCVTLAARNTSDVLLGADDAPVRRNHGYFVIKHGASQAFSPVCRADIPTHKLDEICNFLGYENQTNVEYVLSPASTHYDSRPYERSLQQDDYVQDDVKEEIHLGSTQRPRLREQSSQNQPGRFSNYNHENSSRQFLYNHSDGVRTRYQDNSFTQIPFNETYSENATSRGIGLWRTQNGAVELHDSSTSNTELENSTISGSHNRSRRQAEPQSENKCSQVYVTCGGLRCGTVPRVLRHLANYTRLGSQPWAVGVYSGGQYICGGTLVHKQWALTSRSCVKEHRRDSGSLVVVGGSYRGPISGMRIEGPFERERSVLQMQIVSEDLLLLRLSVEFTETNYINPLCLPKSATSWPGPWLRCAAVGYDGDVLTRHLQLQPASTPCPASAVCFQPYDLPRATCPNRWSGLIACINSTEPMARWVAVGIWQNTLTGCSSPTQHPLLTNDLLLSIRLGMILPSPTSRTTCGGHQCPFGKCIELDRVCDGVPDCADLSDEPLACPLPAFRCRDHNGLVQCGCPADERPCWNGTCVPLGAFCDGTRDCDQGEDEVNCSCSTVQAAHPEAVCNGEIDCADGGDEEQCGCPLNESFRCFQSGDTRTCLPLRYLCDGSKHCASREDEQFCSTLLHIPTENDQRTPVDTSFLIVDLDVLGRPKPQRSGLFMLRYRGRWYTYSLAAWPVEFSERLCQRLGYSSAITEPRTLLPNFNTDPKMAARSVHGIRSASRSGDLDVVHIQCS